MKEDPIFLLNVAVSDNKSLKKLVIDIPGINKHDEVTLSGTEYEYSEEYTFPSEDADYEMSIKVYDKYRQHDRAEEHHHRQRLG